jgi:hypothetical protein
MLNQQGTSTFLGGVLSPTGQVGSRYFSTEDIAAANKGVAQYAADMQAVRENARRQVGVIGTPTPQPSIVAPVQASAPAAVVPPATTASQQPNVLGGQTAQPHPATPLQAPSGVLYSQAEKESALDAATTPLVAAPTPTVIAGAAQQAQQPAQRPTVMAGAAGQPQTREELGRQIVLGEQRYALPSMLDFQRTLAARAANTNAGQAAARFVADAEQKAALQESARRFDAATKAGVEIGATKEKAMAQAALAAQATARGKEQSAYEIAALRSNTALQQSLISAQAKMDVEIKRAQLKGDNTAVQKAVEKREAFRQANSADIALAKSLDPAVAQAAEQRIAERAAAYHQQWQQNQQQAQGAPQGQQQGQESADTNNNGIPDKIEAQFVGANAAIAEYEGNPNMASDPQQAARYQKALAVKKWYLETFRKQLEKQRT